MDGGVPMVAVLARSGIQEVPHRFLRQPEPVSTLCDHLQLPVIRLSDLETPAGIEALDKASREWGFFYLLDHGIPEELIRDTRNVIRAFFELPEEEKKRYSSFGNSTAHDDEGYGRYFVPSEDSPLDWVDAAFHKIPPRTICWPSNPPRYRQIIEEYAEQVHRVDKTILRAMATALHYPAETLVEMLEGSYQSLRMNYYPPCPQPESVMGLSPHSDTVVALTVLLQDEGVQGLQVKKDDQWVSVKPLPNGLVVNVGGVLEIMTNGLYKSVQHRAVVNGAKTRMSAAMFLSPSLEATIRPSLVAADAPAFREMRMKQFLEVFMQQELNGEGPLASLRI